MDDPKTDGVEAAPAGRAPAALDRSALVALVAAEFLVWLLPVAMVAWLCGVVLLSISSYWPLPDKAKAWLWLGSGLPVGMLSEILTRPGQGMPVWALIVILALLIGYFLMQIRVTVRLFRTRR